MRGRLGRKFAGTGAIALLVTVMMIGAAVPVLAHHPEVTAEGFCDEQLGYAISYVAVAWTPPPPGDRNNPDIGVYVRLDGADIGTQIKVDQGEFAEANGYTFGDIIPAEAAWIGQRVIVRVQADGEWGNGIAGGSYWETYANVPEDCEQPEEPGSIRVIKNTSPNTSAEFLFLLAADDVLGDTQLVSGNGGSFTWSELSAGTYDLTEMIGDNPAGYKLSSRSCVLGDSQGGSTWGNITNGVAIDLAEGDQVICTFTNTEDVPPPPPPPPAPDTGAIGDLVWLDANADGYQGDFEAGVAGVTVNLLNSGGSVIATTVTDGAGKYLFSGLAGGTYEVQFVLPAGFEVTPLRAVAVAALDSDAGVAGRSGAIVLPSGVTDLTWDAGIFPTPEVLPQVITTTTSTPPETLPFTGATSGGAGGVGLALLALGSLVLLSVRRREEHTGEALLGG